MSRRKTWIMALALLVLTTLPYLLAIDGSGETVFGGFLFNPNDGNSYLAKMLQGWNGSWRFTLPYTSEPGQGAYLFLFYITLGHLARWLHLPLNVVFHLARCAAGLMLVFALASFYQRIFADRPRLVWPALLLSLFGSGMGWVVVLAGSFAADMWVAEAYPFLSAYANPHFPLGLALMLIIFMRLFSPVSGWGRAVLFGSGLLLSIVMPFGVVVMAAVVGVWTLWSWIDARSVSLADILTLACLFGGGGLFLLYQYAVTLRDPVLSGWNAQNITTSPPLWDVLVSLSPALLLGLAALPGLWRRRADPVQRLLLTWFVLGILLIYLPFSLQRRFMLGIYIPVAALGVLGLADLARNRLRFGPVVAAVLLLSVLTNAGVLLAGWVGIQKHNALMYLSAGEERAFSWINANTPRDALVLSSAEMGLFLPAHTGRRVIYGHPFETVNALEEQENLRAFFTSGELEGGRAFLAQRGVDYVLYGPREADAGSPAVLQTLEPVYEQDGITIYRVAAP